MKHFNYITRASRRFLSGTPYRSPVDAVAHGVKSLEEWAKVLNEERERAQLQLAMKRPRHPKPRHLKTRNSSEHMKGRE